MNLKIHYRIIISILCLCILFFVSWPLYKYITDPDGASYAAIADHYNNGNLSEAVNSLWSPLHSWIVIPFIKSGLSTIIAFKISNLLIGILFLISIHLYLIQSGIKSYIQNQILAAAIIIILYYIWYELAADMLFSLIIFNYLKLSSSIHFKDCRKKNMVAGILGGAAYLSKAIGLPFFIIHYSAVHYFGKRASPSARSVYWIGLLFCMMIAVPWIYILYLKYNHLMMSAHLRLTLNPVIYSTDGFFLPPHHLSYFIWEDPWTIHNKFSSPIDSISNLLTYMRKLLYNFQEYLNVLFRISFLAPGICFLSIIFYLKKSSEKTYFTLMTLFILPGLYILFHIEERFLWPISFVIMIAGVFYINELLSLQKLKKHSIHLIWAIFFGSFLIEPVNQLKDSSYRNKDIHDIAHLMQKHHIQGTFTSNKKYIECGVIAYISKNKYYTPSTSHIEINKLIFNAKKYGIKYILLFTKNEYEKKCLISSLPDKMNNSLLILSDKILAVNLQ